MSVAATIGRRAVKIANGIVNFVVLIAILLLIAFGCYALWDSDQVFAAADATQYEIYKPNVPAAEGPGFGELQALNPDVFAWLTIYGTNIDYPVTQGEDNMQYVNHNAQGDYSISGSIFLDCDNNNDFSDFNSIFFGHHMEKQTMFGEIGLFSGEEYFNARQYGNLYYGGIDHGLEFFAFLHVDAYDGSVFSPGVQGEQAQQLYLDNLLDKASFTRDIGVTVEDRIVLLSTCSNESTNGRDILVARITDTLFDDTFIPTETNDTGPQAEVDAQGSIWAKIPLWLWFTIPGLLVLILLIVVLYKNHQRRKRIREIMRKHRAYILSSPYRKKPSIPEESDNKET